MTQVNFTHRSFCYKQGLNKLVKFLFANLYHHGFCYTEGLNKLTEQWNPFGNCERGGLYYTNLANAGHWCAEYALVADVTLPSDARIYAEPCGTKWKCDQLILSNIRPIWQLFAEHPEICLAAVQQNALALKFVTEQTPEICLAAVQQDGYVLEFVKEAAVQANCRALRFYR